jgi:hypothetical protein
MPDACFLPAPAAMPLRIHAHVDDLLAAAKVHQPAASYCQMLHLPACCRIDDEPHPAANLAPCCRRSQPQSAASSCWAQMGGGDRLWGPS